MHKPDTDCGECGIAEENNDTDMPDPESERVARLLDADESWGSPPEAPHPLCRSCFVRWVHRWLGVDAL